jgi:hypothetical protein
MVHIMSPENTKLHFFQQKQMKFSLLFGLNECIVLSSLFCLKLFLHRFCKFVKSEPNFVQTYCVPPLTLQLGISFLETIKTSRWWRRLHHNLLGLTTRQVGILVLDTHSSQQRGHTFIPFCQESRFVRELIGHILKEVLYLFLAFTSRYFQRRQVGGNWLTLGSKVGLIGTHV